MHTVLILGTIRIVQATGDSTAFSMGYVFDKLHNIWYNYTLIVIIIQATLKEIFQFNKTISNLCLFLLLF